MTKAFRASHVAALLHRFLRGTEGSVLALGALLIPILGGASLFGLDHMRATQQISAMQKAADAAALASVRQMAFVRIGNDDDTTAQNEALTAIAEGLVRSTLDHRLPDTQTVAELLEEGLVRISLTARYGSLFGELGAFGENPFTVTSSAQTYGGHDVCVISLGAGDNPGIDMEDSAQLKGGTCEVYSNSTRKDSIKVDDSARIEARLICSSGGYDGNGSNFSSEPATDCTQIEDPLIDYTPPDTSAPCMHDDLDFEAGNYDMEPGVYCGKVMIEKDANVLMQPGVYIFRDSEIHVHDDAVLTGTGVGLYFEGKKSKLHFQKDTRIRLSAPVTGPMAGILLAARPYCKGGGIPAFVFGAPPCSSGRTFLIESAKVEALLGTIHLPTDTLEIDTDMPVSEEAAFTIIVVGRLKIENSPTLVLNTDYDATNVPVPAGFRDGNKTPPRLVR